MLKKNGFDCHVFIFIALLFAMNMVQSGMMDLSHDEAYYWVYSLFPAWGYYDHPPMVGWMIRSTAFLGKSEVLVRLPFALMQGGAVWLMWELAGKKNFYVFICACLAFPLLLAAGFLALPDTPLMFFSLLFWFLAGRYKDREKLWHIPVIALVIAAMFYSKYHSLVVVLLTVFSMPEVLKRGSFWIVVGLVVCFYLPHVHWQHQHDFISLDFHLNKRSGKSFDVMNVLGFIGSQIALGGFFAFLIGLYCASKRGWNHKMLFLNSIGFFLFVFALSFRNKIEANWTVTAFAAFAPLLCRVVETKKAKKVFIVSCVPVIAILFAFRGIMLPSYEHGSYPIERMGEVKGWQDKADDIISASSGHPLYAETYQIASKLSFYGEDFVRALSLRSRESQFSLLKVRSKIQKDDKISFVGPKRTKDAIEIETGYKGPVYVSPGIVLEDLLIRYRRDYEEAIRN